MVPGPYAEGTLALGAVWAEVSLARGFDWGPGDPVVRLLGQRSGGVPCVHLVFGWRGSRPMGCGGMDQVYVLPAIYG